MNQEAAWPMLEFDPSFVWDHVTYPWILLLNMHEYVYALLNIPPALWWRVVYHCRLLALINFPHPDGNSSRPSGTSAPWVQTRHIFWRLYLPRHVLGRAHANQPARSVLINGIAIILTIFRTWESSTLHSFKMWGCSPTASNLSLNAFVVPSSTHPLRYPFSALRH